ncbi:MAG: cyclase family protein [Victivallaceae bacterium]|nr:cyclase family protein [Victivallaceae bacterium]
MIVEQLADYRVVDLSKPVDPANSIRLCKVERFFQESSKDYHSNLTVESHLGTHIETPYHYRDAWKDILELPVTAFMGRAVLLKLECEPGAPITRKMLDAANLGRVRAGDVVILTSPYHCEPFSNDPNDQRPYLCRESGEWFAEKKVKCIGFGDSAAIEHSVKDACDVHEAVMPHDIMFLEVMQNLDRLETEIFMIIYQPMPIKGLDSCCVRALAIEGVPGFC